MKPIYRLIDLFCGTGGFSEGFRITSRFKHLLAIDSLPSAARTYKANFPEALILVEDIRNVDGRLIRDLVGEIDVVIGSPPCEPFTGANPHREPYPLDRLYKDPIGRLTLHFIRIVSDLEPQVFIMENVPAIMDDGLKHAIRREFKIAGYSKVYFNILYAEDYGTPSHRTRVFISNIELKPQKLERRVVVREALSGLPEPGSTYPPNHEETPIPRRKLKRIAKLRWGQAMIYYEGARGRLPNLIRLHPDRIAPTVQGSSRFIHPFENRFLTVREQARLMGFPDTFVFLGGRDEQYNQVGEAVPVPLAKAIAYSVLDFLDRGGDL